MAKDQRKTIETMKLVIWFMTPFAVFLVGMGVFFGHPETAVARFAIGIVFFTCWGNLASLYLLDRFPSRAIAIRNGRVVFNYLFNLGLIYLLLPYWRPIWILLLLTILAVAVYETRESTIVHAALFTFMLFFVAFLHGLVHGKLLGELIQYAATIWFAGLFVNKLATMPASRRS